MSDSGEEITVENHTNVQNPKDVNNFSAVDAVSLFNTKIDIALDKQRASTVSEMQEKLQANTEFKGEGNKIQFSFNQERLVNLDRIKNCLSRGSVEEVFELIDSEKNALTPRNKLLRIADRHGWGTVEEYSDSDITDNSEDASKLRAAIFRASKKRQTPVQEIHPHNHLFSVLDQEFSTACQITSFFSALKTTVSAKISLQEHRFQATDKTSLQERTLPATTVTCPGISPNSVPTQPNCNVDKHLPLRSPVQNLSTSRIKVEYSNLILLDEQSEFDSNFRLKSKTVKNSLKNCLEF
ncbi:unnamed protein product [Mytilus coruscus]|uniref:Uncharacterized protein n=1 Tax=Mytilus coruscus TaxID=42192 RepID=A0A6J8A5M2_MYTCO|nr:unnamed protein product [Mytilus coruscus]